MAREPENFAARIAPAGAANGLAQALIKLTAPGVPDIYQGTQYWDLSLVDADGRTAVDFGARIGSLDAVLPADLADNWRDGRIKQALIARTLAVRKKAPALFAKGPYRKLETIGPNAGHIVAFARVLGHQFAVAVACRLPFHLLAEDSLRTADRWNSTRIALPTDWRTDERVDVLDFGPDRSYVGCGLGKAR
jgi:(1->4)-alpha-D-glucan 1-alpha-D-glucosylmutase